MAKRVTNPVKVTKPAKAVKPSAGVPSDERSDQDVKPAPAAADTAQQVKLGKCTCCIWKGPLQDFCPVCECPVIAIERVEKNA